MKPVNDKRNYTSPRREMQAAQSRRAVLDAAHGLFANAGWQKTTIAAIAATAGVSKELIYSTFGNKHAILQAVVSAAVRGPELDRPLLDQDAPQAIHRQTDPEKLLEHFAEDISKRLERVAPLMRAVAAAQQSEAKLAELYRALHTGRRNNLAVVVDDLEANGALAEGVTCDDALTHIWRLTSPELFSFITTVEGATPKQFADWLGNSLKTALLRN